MLIATVNANTSFVIKALKLSPLTNTSLKFFVKDKSSQLDYSRSISK